jgi:hypothetical protein
MDNDRDGILRTVNQKQKWFFDWHVMLAFFFIGTGIGIPLGIAMLVWRAWSEYKGQFWERKQSIGDLNNKAAEAIK